MLFTVDTSTLYSHETLDMVQLEAAQCRMQQQQAEQQQQAAEQQQQQPQQQLTPVLKEQLLTIMMDFDNDMYSMWCFSTERVNARIEAAEKKMARACREAGMDHLVFKHR